jgi:rhodanese-related sulfurtransferase
MFHPAIPEVSVVDLQRRVSDGEQVYLLDVRTPEEFAAYRLPFTSALIPHDELAIRHEQLPRDHQTPIFTFCRTGRRSQYAAEILRAMGYPHTFNVAGGIVAWIAAGFEIVGD